MTVRLTVSVDEIKCWECPKPARYGMVGLMGVIFPCCKKHWEERL